MFSSKCSDFAQCNTVKTSRCGWCWCSSIQAADKKVENGCTGNDSRSGKEDQPRPEITINGLGGGRLGPCFSCFTKRDVVIFTNTQGRSCKEQ